MTPFKKLTAYSYAKGKWVNITPHDEENTQLKAENTKLREVLNSCAVLLTDNQFLHWPELLEETLEAMRELGIKV